MNFLSFGINIVVGLWLIPYLIKNLGTAAYGLIPLAMVFTEYVSLITISINSAITRFITIDIQNNNWEKANKTISTAFVAILMLIFLQILILGYITHDIARLINIPEGFVKDAYYLFALTFTGYLISLFSSIFSTSMYAKNRLDLTKTVDISRATVRIITLVSLFVLVKPSLIIVGIANLLGSITSLVLSYSIRKKLTPNISMKISSFDKVIFKRIATMGGWIIISQVGYLLFLKIDLLVINLFIGPEAGGQYAAVQQWNNLIRTIGAILSGLIGPMIIITYSKNDIQGVVKYGYLGVRYLSSIIGIITGILCGLATPLLDVWLGHDFKQFSTLLFIMLCHLSINIGVLPLFSINTALNKVKLPGLATLSMGLINLVMAIVFVKIFDLGILGVALAGLIVLTLKNGVFTPWYASYILKSKISTFYKPLLWGVVLFLLSFTITHFVGYLFDNYNWLKIILHSSFVFLIISIFTYFVILKEEEKAMLLELLITATKRRIN